VPRLHLFLDVNMGIVRMVLLEADCIWVLQVLEGLSDDAFEAFVSIQIAPEVLQQSDFLFKIFGISYNSIA